MASSSKKKKIQQMELQDAKGISRKKWKHTMNPNLFILIKLIIIALIPIFYFVYSPLLIFVFIAYIGLFFLARMAERSMNKSVIKSNHIHISKIDSGVAMIIVIIALCGGLLSATQKNAKSAFQGMPQTEFSQKRGNMDFSSLKKQAEWAQFKQKLINIGSLLTGERNLFKEEKTFKFTPAERPKNFIKDKSEIPELPADFDPSSFGGFGGGGSGFGGGFGGEGNFMPGGGRGKNFNFSFDNIPINYVTSSTMSTISTVLIFSVAGLGLISIFAIYLKKRKFEREMSEVIIETKIELLSEGELERILSFGEETEETKLSKKEINERIKAENIKTKENVFEVETTSINQKDEEIEILNNDAKSDKVNFDIIVYAVQSIN